MEIRDFIEQNMQNMIDDITEFVAIPSVFDPETATAEKPFGEEVNRGLEWILAKAETMGFAVKNIDGYAGEITAGSGDYIIGVLAHEDVVAGGDDWDTPAFEGVVKDGALYGRGTIDDKGPLISALYGMKYLMDEEKIPEGTALRMIVGTNEEEDWGGINYYVDHVDKLPNYSIVPDAYFPLIYCEKGLLDFDVSMKLENVDDDAEIVVKALHGGAAKNVVAGKVYATLTCKGMKEKKVAAALNRIEGIQASAGILMEDGVGTGTVEVVVQGQTAHAMAPEKGVNAISVLMKALNGLLWTTSIDAFVEAYSESIGMGYNGKEMGIGFEDELSGILTQNIGIIRMEDDVITLECNIRYPASLEKEATIGAIRDAWEKAGFDFMERTYLPPVYIRPDSDFVQKLMSVYQKVTGDTASEAMAIGGATYARGIPNAVAFGPLFPYEEELAHEANECLNLESLDKMTEIYICALESLLKM